MYGTIEKDVKGKHDVREGFFALAMQVFGLSFQAWYQGGYWTDRYIPYAMLDGGKVVANVSVNRMDMLWKGQPKRYIQIGTVMTDAAYRNCGLSRRLMEEVLADWRDQSDAIYLFANDTVLDFYPRFGFGKATEYQCSRSVAAKHGDVRRLDMGKSEDRDFLKAHYAKSNPFSALPMIQNEGLLMFACTSLGKDCVFYCADFDAVVIAIQSPDELTCMDVFCDAGPSLQEILAGVATEGTRKVILGFTPTDTTDYAFHVRMGEEETLFVLQDKENLFAHHQAMFPLLSHA